MIRRLTPRDAAIWREIRLEALRTDPQAFSSRYEDWADRPLSDFTARLAGAGIFIFEDAGAALGAAILSPDADPARTGRGRVEAVFTRPHARGRGISTGLVRAIVSAARDQGLVELFLDVHARNSAARRVYERAGFAVTADRPEGSNKACEITMRLALGGPLAVAEGH